jgi:hypothetical protein
MTGARGLRLGLLVALVLCAAPLHAQQTAPPPVAAAPATVPAGAGVAPPDTTVAPAVAPAGGSATAGAPSAAPSGTLSGVSSGAASGAETGPGAGPIPTDDATPAPSDHDAVVGHVGVAARRLDPGPLPLALRPGQGCAAAMTTACTVTLGAVGARYWMNRDVAFNGYLVLGTGGGSVGATALDTYVGVGPILGMTLLLANWKHLAIGASPELAVVWFRPAGGDSDSTTLFQLRASIEGELHFGFIGVPALSIGLQAGAQVLYEHAPAGHLWSVGVIGSGSIWDALSTIYVRYYL